MPMTDAERLAEVRRYATSGQHGMMLWLLAQLDAVLDDLRDFCRGAHDVCACHDYPCGSRCRVCAAAAQLARLMPEDRA